MGLNLSTYQIAQELDLNKDDAQQMTSQLRTGIVGKKPKVILAGEVELDELYLIAGFKGQPAEVRKRGDQVAPGGSKPSQGEEHWRKRNHRFLA